VSGSAFYNLSALEEIAVNLFYGWGYNFYRVENQLRADDLLLRAKVCWLLGLCRATLEAKQSDFRRKFLPPPSRENPRPPPEVVVKAQALEELSGRVGQLEARVRALPVPESDRMTQRYRRESFTLEQLRRCDAHLVGRVQTLHDMLAGKGQEWILENAELIREGLASMQQSLEERQTLLQ
jgi:hypothetical protein